MRTQPITLPAVAALLVGAALVLLSGCVVEGGLEPIGELLEVGPELPEGVSAGPDGSITIGKGLAIPGASLSARRTGGPWRPRTATSAARYGNATANVRGAVYACANGMANGGNV